MALARRKPVLRLIVRRSLSALLASLLCTATFAMPGRAHQSPPRATAWGGDSRSIDRAATQALRLARGHRLVILGDLHGTREIPLLVGDMIDRTSRRQPVTLALEMPRSEQPSLDAALAARDAAVARRQLLDRPWWRRGDNQHDGRRSVDMLELIERLRTLRQQGRDVALLAYDVDESVMSSIASADASARDEAMAARVRQACLDLPRRRIVMLTGNFHAFLRIPSYMAAPAGIVTAGMRLADLAPASLRIGALRGQGWFCVDKACKAIPVGPAGAPTEGEFTGAISLPALHVGRLVTLPMR
ncbi:ChaN family lipoprotein [Cognatilysobacter lacus]|uniref:ChaN family lipoprotein n=1 Tax=Cognatilysobacter lacus TaxID=1643323 RepID=A0A5D8ZBK7_9GAMM|nr:ChaN family lipoprotein [Lysobacter lacus]TZF91502.1 ChaN family lipoprotein [Lysobacter lacus]